MRQVYKIVLRMERLFETQSQFKCVLLSWGLTSIRTIMGVKDGGGFRLQFWDSLVLELLSSPIL